MKRAAFGRPDAIGFLGIDDLKFRVNFKAWHLLP